MFTMADVEMSRKFFEQRVKVTLGPVEMQEIMDDPEMKGKFMLIDVRNREGYNQEHVPEAINIPLAELESRLSEISKDKEIIVYCWTMVCHLSARAGLLLANHGYFVRELEGGIQQWKAYEMPIETGAMAGVK